MFRFPFTDIHELNLDWIISKIKHIEERTKRIVNSVNGSSGDVQIPIPSPATINPKPLGPYPAIGTDPGYARGDHIHPMPTIPDPVEPYNSPPAAMGTASAGISEKYARGDHVHPLDATVQQQITDWLENNVDPETGYVIDTSLTIAGAAADAKATGDAIDEINDTLDLILDETNLFDATDVTDGKRLNNTGQAITGVNYFVSAYIPVVAGATYRKNSPTEDGYHRLCVFDDTKTFIPGGAYNDNTVTIPEGGAYIEFCGEIAEKATTTFVLITAKDVIARESGKVNSFARENWMDRRYQDGEFEQFTKKTPGHLIVTFTVDDSHADISDIASAFAAVNVPLCLTTIPNYLGNLCNSGDTVLEVCQDVQNNGGEILTHNNFVLGANTASDRYYTYFVESKQKLNDAGLIVNGIIKTGGIEPGGPPSIPAMLRYLRSYYDYGTGFSTVGDGRYTIGRTQLNASTDFNAIKTQIDNAVSGGYFNFYTHGQTDFPGDSTWLTTLMDLVAYIQAKQDAVIITIGEMFRTCFVKSFKS